jgi:fibronectin type 3 domain-containing protein
LEVKNAKVTKMKSKSVITWDATPKAGSYNVYKKNRTTQALELVENVNQPRIEINIVGDIVEYDDFVIKAVLDDGQCNIESPNSAEMTKVQTGPKEMILLLIAV